MQLDRATVQVADFNLSRSVMHGDGISHAELNSVEWAAPEKLAGQVSLIGMAFAWCH